MSRDPGETHVEILGALARELRQFLGLSSSFVRAAAARSGMTVTDLQVLEFLESVGPMTAGQLAELTGLTTGAVTGMLNRLEESGLLRRERDPDDGRRVIVRLATSPEGSSQVGPIFDLIGKSQEELASHYDDEQLALLLEFLQRSNALSRQALAQLREAPQDEQGIYSAPLGNLVSGRLVIPAGIYRLTVRAGSEMVELYQAHFLGTVPDVKTDNGVVTIRYPRRLWVLGGGQSAADVFLNAAIPWSIIIHGGASEITAELGGLNIAGLDLKGGMSTIRLDLPVPAGVVPIRISGGASMITVRRPAGVAARVHLKGWASELAFDEQKYSNLGNDVRLQSQSYDVMAPSYDIEVASSVSMVTITAEPR